MPDKQKTIDATPDARLLALETGHNYLDAQIREIKSDVHEVKTAVDKIAANMGKPNAAHQQNIIAVITLLVVIGGGLATFLSNRIAEIEEHGDERLAADHALELQRLAEDHALELRIVATERDRASDRKAFDEHAAAGDHPWGVLSRVQDNEARIGSIETLIDEVKESIRDLGAARD